MRYAEIIARAEQDIQVSVATGHVQGFAWVPIVMAIGLLVIWLWNTTSGY